MRRNLGIGLFLVACLAITTFLYLNKGEDEVSLATTDDVKPLYFRDNSFRGLQPETTTTTIPPTTTTTIPPTTTTTTIPPTTTTTVAPTTTQPPEQTSTSVDISTGSVWDRLAQCESGGNWSINTGNGYYGGLQFDHSTWLSNGGGQYAEYPHQASRAQQIATAEVLRAARGFYPWPACAAQLGLI